MSRKTQTYTPKPQESEQKTFGITEASFFVTKEAYIENVKHLEYRIDELTDRLDKVPTIIEKELDTFKLSLSADKKSENSNFLFKLIPIIISVGALAFSIYTSFFK